MIRIHDLHFSWPGGSPLFQGLNLTLPKGCVIAILGPNGAGKSTLLRLITGLEQPARGKIEIAGQDTGAADNLAQRIGAVMQSSDRHFLRSSVLEEVAVGPRILGLADPLGLARQALDRVGLGADADHHPMDLDTGARRLVSLASAIVHAPQVLALDEVQRGLDQLNRDRLQSVIALEAARGATVLLVSHDPDFVRQTATMALRFSSAGLELKAL